MASSTFRTKAENPLSADCSSPVKPRNRSRLLRLRYCGRSVAVDSMPRRRQVRPLSAVLKLAIVVHSPCRRHRRWRRWRRWPECRYRGRDSPSSSRPSVSHISFCYVTFRLLFCYHFQATKVIVWSHVRRERYRGDGRGPLPLPGLFSSPPPRPGHWPPFPLLRTGRRRWRTSSQPRERLEGTPRADTIG